MSKELSHIDLDGNAVMVDVSNKEMTKREATAVGTVLMQAETLKTVIDYGVKKGDVLTIAQLAGIMGAKRTADLIPLCHPLTLSSVKVDLECKPEDNAIDITATAKITHQTGVEMEALTAVSVAALTIYDMCKAIDKSIRITNVRLIRKKGGRSGTYESS
ncbi:MAG: cyclic pyranopterin monophosphate synthase MoaC [Rhodospirillaceae bacterium]